MPPVEYTVSASVGEGGAVSPENANVTGGGTASFTVTPNTGYSIASITGCDGSLSGNTYTTGTVTADCTVNVSFVLNVYTVTATSGANGSVSPLSQTVNHGETTTLTVIPNNGYSVSGVTGCNGNLSVSPTLVSPPTYIYTTGPVTADCTVSANFSAAPPLAMYMTAVSASPENSGNVTGGGTVAAGSIVTVSATPNTGYTFGNWTEGGTEVSTSSSYTFTASANRTLVANFTINSYTVTATAGTNGTITPVSQAANHGSTTSFTVTPNMGYSIATVTGCLGTLSGNTYTTGPITANCEVTASFVVNTYTISLSASPAAAGNVTGGGSVSAGTTVTVTATPNTGYTFTNWTEGGTQVSTNSGYTFTASANRTLGANFAVSAGYYTIGGTVSNLTGTLVLQNNGGNDLTVSASGPFFFTSPIASGADYVVTIKTQPASQQCSVTGGSGTATANVTAIEVQCLTTAHQPASTGQTTCYDASASGQVISCSATGQDGELQKGVAWPVPRFIVGAGAESGCVTDNLTGLQWAQNGDLPAATKTWQEALDYVAALNSDTGLCGHNDWRLPNKNELRSVAHYGVSNTAAWLNNASQGFNSVQSATYWSSTTLAITGLTSFAWKVNLMDGYLLTDEKTSSSYVLPVRSTQSTASGAVVRTGQTVCYDVSGVVISCGGTGQDGDLQAGVVWPASRFVAGVNMEASCVTDGLTGLMWSKDANLPAGARSWQQALDYVAAMNNGSGLCGYTDWRMPNVNELQSLGNAGDSLGTWLSVNGFDNVQGIYWSSSSRSATPGYAWVVNLTIGMPSAYKGASSYYVWPVRGGQ